MMAPMRRHAINEMLEKPAAPLYKLNGGVVFIAKYRAVKLESEKQGMC